MLKIFKPVKHRESLLSIFLTGAIRQDLENKHITGDSSSVYITRPGLIVVEIGNQTFEVEVKEI